MRKKKLTNRVRLWYNTFRVKETEVDMLRKALNAVGFLLAMALINLLWFIVLVGFIDWDRVL